MEPYIHWDQREERRKWARELLARYGWGVVRDNGSGFYRPAVIRSANESDRSAHAPVRLPVGKTGRNAQANGLKAGVLVEIRPESRHRSRRVVLESLGQQTLFP